MFSDLDPSVVHRVQASIGWLELGSPGEARQELLSLPPEIREKPELLELLWLIEARLEAWDDALATAEKLLAVRPATPVPWLHRAYAARRASGGSLQRAWDYLRPAFEKFPNEATVPYNLACYACQLGQMDEARWWLEQARKRGVPGEIDRMARCDPDLQPLWPELSV